MDIKNLIRVGRVSSVNPSNCTARVVFNAQENNVSYELPVLQLFAKDNKAYSLPDIDTQVVCIYQPDASGKGLTTGYIVGACYSTADTPAENDASVKSMRFADGSFICYDGQGNLEINMTGNVVIKGAKIMLN